ncbi:hypothetical protein N7486_011130 [Penicillium sp. IBT 16267x]|nr:hypothetical protein N7486_011130 [Penicillium sp. IBT 16267x]
MDTEPGGEPRIQSPSENDVIDDSAADIEERSNESTMAALEVTAEGLLDGSPMNKTPAAIDEVPKKYPTEQGDLVEPEVGSLAD